MAKENGRNQVVQLGGGMHGRADESGDESEASESDEACGVVRQTLVTPVPTKIAIEKLRGFVADHQATIVKIDGNQIQLELLEHGDGRFRRTNDRPVNFQLDLRFEEQRAPHEVANGEVSVGAVKQTRIFVRIAPRKSRDRRRSDLLPRAQQCWQACVPISWRRAKKNRRLLEAAPSGK